MSTQTRKSALQLLAAATLFTVMPAVAAEADANGIFNPVIQKLAAGGQVVGGTVSSADIDVYCAMASSGFDFLWIEMQHSPLTYAQVAAMIRACPGPAVPFIRVPTDSEGDIQKAVDIGALGVIVPMVDTVEKIENAIKFAMYPPLGKRSQGGGQYGALWGREYRAQANDNIMIVAMIENQAGVELADEIAALPEVDVVFAASSDIGSFTGLRQGDPDYEALITRIKDATLGAGKYLAGPSAWKGTRDGYTFFQGPGETQLIRSGARLSLEGEAEQDLPRGVAPIEGQE
ncbi:MAG TPA: aldolase/citrate lyase family protein [Pseudomonadales bacterium]